MSSTDPEGSSRRSYAQAPFVGERRPLVSVCIPTRDRAAYLRQALDSVIGQDGLDLEILVFDDASTDDTAAVVEDLGDRRIVYHRHPRPLGIAGNRNACLETARGRYLAWLDDDDAYLPGGLERQVRLLEEQPDVSLAHGAIEVVDELDRPRPDWPVPFDVDTVEPGLDAFEELILSNYVRAPTAVVRTEAQRRAGPYASVLGDRAEDWDAWLRLALEGDVSFERRPVARYRCHSASASRDRASSLAWLASEARVVRRALERAEARLPDPDATRRRAWAALAARHIEAAGDAMTRGRTRVAYRAVRRAMRVAPPLAALLRPATEHARRGDEHRYHTAVRPALEQIAELLAGHRHGRGLRAQLDATEAWSGERTAVATRIRQVVPRGAAVAAVDKWDPSLLHEARRDGWHFPDLALAPDGYPSGDQDAIEHLDAQRGRGAEYLVLPRASFWWLDHYLEFSRHLDRHHEPVWRDEICLIYRLHDARGEAVA